MNPDRLLQNFDRLIDTPDAVPRLRRFILDLAVRGKLVEQDPEDEPAGAIKRGKLFPEVTVAEAPFNLPSNWRWVRIGECLELINGRAFKPTDWQEAGLPIVRIQNLNSINASFNFCDERLVKERHLINSGSFLISWSGTPGTSFGAFIWDKGKAALNQHIFKCFQIGNVFFDKFLRLSINGRLDEMIAKAHGGVGLQHITKGKLENLILPLPPLAEQHRIVAKIDELMALCDEVEAAQAKRGRRRDRLVAATLHGLNNGDASAEANERFPFKESARFYFNHLPRLTTRSEHIQQLRQTILNLAVKGKLVQQDSKDESVIDLIELIALEQRASIEGGGLKKNVKKDNAAPYDMRHSIPKDWRWVRLTDLIIFGPQNGVSPKKTNNVEAAKALTLTATTSGYFDSTYYKHVELREADSENYWLSPGDVLFQRGNTREYVGMAAVFDGPERTFVFPDLMIRVRFSEALNLRFIHRVLISPPLRHYFSISATGASSTMPKINQGVLLNAPIPLPPVAEQHRIMSKVDELMALCDEIEARITTNTTTSRKLLEATLQEAINGGTKVA